MDHHDNPHSRSGNIHGHTKVNTNGIFQVDTIKTTTPYTYTEHAGANIYNFTGTNFSWRLPRMQYGLDLEVRVLNDVALCGGGSYSTMDQNKYWQAYGMVSTLFSSPNGSSVRIDAGVELQNIDYRADFVRTDIHLISNNEVTFLQVHQKDSYIDPFFAFTIHGSSSVSPVNLFLQAAVVLQTLYSISNATGIDSVLNGNRETHYLYSLSPGMNIQVCKNLFILTGMRFIWDASMESKTTTTLQPFLQFDVGL